jgi:hypothetical protein
MRWLDVVEFVGLVLLALLAVFLLLPLIVLSLQIVLVTGLLFAAGLVCSWLSKETAQLHTWLVAHHRISHRITARRA